MLLLRWLGKQGVLAMMCTTSYRYTKCTLNMLTITIASHQQSTAIATKSTREKFYCTNSRLVASWQGSYCHCSMRLRKWSSALTVTSGLCIK